MRFVEERNLWDVNDAADVRALLRHASIGLGRRAESPGTGSGRPDPVTFLSMWMSLRPQASHLAIRRVLATCFGTAHVARLADSFADAASASWGDCPHRFDLVRDFFEPFWSRCLLAFLTGEARVDLSLVAQVKALSKVLGKQQYAPQDLAVIADAIDAFVEVTDRAIANAADCSAGDRITRIATAEGRNGYWYAVATVAQILAAGLAPTATAFVETALSHPPSQPWRPDELVVRDPPFPYVYRQCIDDLTLAGRVLRKGQLIRLDLRSGCAGDAIDEGFRLSPRSMAFGQGAFKCPGAELSCALIDAAMSHAPSFRTVTMAGTDKPVARTFDGYLHHYETVLAERIERA